MSQSLVLTLKLDSLSFAVLNELRQQYFPPERNFLPAHITLFHALPGDRKQDIEQILQSLSARTKALQLYFPKLRFLGRGVAVEVVCPELILLQKELASQWNIWLTSQDRQKYRPHATIQNKVDPGESRRLYDRLANTWQAFEGCGEGLMLWYYRGGPWELASEFAFASI